MHISFSPRGEGWVCLLLIVVLQVTKEEAPSRQTSLDKNSRMIVQRPHDLSPDPNFPTTARFKLKFESQLSLLIYRNRNRWRRQPL